MTEFTPITSQEEFDERIKARLAREREKWEKDSGTEDLKAQLAAKDEEIAELHKAHWRENTERLIREQLAAKGIAEEGRVSRVMRLLDFDALAEREGQEDMALRSQLEVLSKDVPELLDPERFRVHRPDRGASARPILKPEKPLTRDELEGMSEQEINSRWDQVRAFLAGERS